jgi:ribonuclease VapC
MIAVDTSALMAILLGEPEAEACAEALAADDALVVSAVTVAEALIVAARRKVTTEMERLIAGLGFQIIHVTPESARRVAAVYERWGTGVHPAGLNFGDCFSYTVATEHGCPLLWVGRDFTQTDVDSLL